MADDILCSLRLLNLLLEEVIIGALEQHLPITPRVTTMRNIVMRQPCFHGNSVVRMADGKLKVSKMIKGDKVATASGSIGTIRCVVKTIISKGKLPMVGFNSGLLITEWHPIRINNIGASQT